MEELNNKTIKIAKTFIVADGKTCYKYNRKTRIYGVVKYSEKDINNYIKLEDKGVNILESKSDVITYAKTIQNVCDALKIPFALNPHLIDIKLLIKYIVDINIVKLPVVEDLKILETIDLSSAGGCLVANVGTHKGQFSTFDINNSYNSFFKKYDTIPSNPKYKTIKNIEEIKNRFALFKLDVIYEPDRNSFLKMGREKWFTMIDIEIFNNWNVQYKLSNDDNNCIIYDEIKHTLYPALELINTLKQNANINNVIEKKIYKLLLSSLWGMLCQYNTTTRQRYGKAIDAQYILEDRTNPITRELVYKNPDCIYRYSMALLKPFILANGRSNVISMYMECKKNGYSIIHSHTDSITTNTEAIRLFEIGSEIGQWKEEYKYINGVEIKNIACKKSI